MHNTQVVYMKHVHETCIWNQILESQSAIGYKFLECKNKIDFFKYQN